MVGVTTAVVMVVFAGDDGGAALSSSSSSLLSVEEGVLPTCAGSAAAVAEATYDDGRGRSLIMGTDPTQRWRWPSFSTPVPPPRRLLDGGAARKNPRVS